MIVSSVTQDGDEVHGLYESSSTYLKIHYINRGGRPDADTSDAHLDVKQMFRTMEALDRRKGRK